MHFHFTFALCRMANLYLIEQGAVLRKTGDRLIVEKDDKELLEVECFQNRHDFSLW